ncbi:MAG: hypothetical protein RRC07_15065, partial [Anaerolineae bacterium]|nr:hypothetical protein [Anaerolineae bacterium]
MKRIILPLLLFLTLLAVGCGGPSAGPEPTATAEEARGEVLPLDETRWELDSILGAPIVPETALTIRFVNNY